MVVRFRRIAFLLLFFFAAVHLSGDRRVLAQPGDAEISGKPPVIVIGFVGGFVSRTNSVHREVQLAADLRREYPEGIYAQVFENHRSDDARQQIIHLLDTNHDGKLSASEKQNARIIIYGHSWGASETVELARLLGRDGIPVVLTIQVDSITKHGENDSLIPPNVGEAVNYYQPDGILHGTPLIRAADPAHTQVLGNFRFDYKDHPVDCSAYPWIARTLEKAHIEIENDPRVWGEIESLIRAKLPVANTQALAASSSASPTQR